MQLADVWYVLLALLLTGYVVLDGFDLGAGALHRLLARDDRERRELLATIGPFWDGNEVFLLAAGGTLFTAFSRVLAAALSGLYLAVMLVLWTILLRGLSIELRSHLRDRLWRTFWDTVFPLASGGLALLLGVALGDVLRGFPLEDDGYFSLVLFSLASPNKGLGVIDGYTLSTGALSLIVLSAHGARFVAMRASGELSARATRTANRLAAPILLVWTLVTALSYWFAHDAVTTLLARPWAWPLGPMALASLGASVWLGTRGRLSAAFGASIALVVSLLGMAAASSYPVLVRSTTHVPSLTTLNAANADDGLAIGLHWWPFAFALVVLYFANLFRIHRGKATTYGEGGEDGVQ